MDLTDDQVAELRRQLAIAGDAIDPAGTALIDTRETARRLGVSADYVREHADELGAVRLGGGPKPRLRFDPTTIAEQLKPLPKATPIQEPSPPRRRSRSATQPRGELLPIRGERP
jgi:hypothetical protein